MKWEEAAEAAKKAGGSGNFLSLKNDGDKEIVAFLGEPVARFTVFLEDEKKTVPFTEEHRKKGLRERTTFLINVYCFSDGKVRVAELNAMTFKDLIKVREKYGLTKWKFEFQRNGKPRDPKTTYSLLPEEQLTDDERKMISAVNVHDIEKMASGGDSNSGEEQAPELGSFDAEGNDGVADEKSVKSIVDRLKALPRDMANDFLKKFGLAKVKELPAKKVKEALAYVAELEATHAGASAPADSEDPFA
jgi:hypothetical protein